MLHKIDILTEIYTKDPMKLHALAQGMLFKTFSIIFILNQKFF